MEAIIGDRDNINSALLINSATNFSGFDFNFTEQSDSMSASQSQAETDAGFTPDSGNKPRSSDKYKVKGKKRKHSSSHEPKIIELFTEQWKEEKEEHHL